MQKSLCKTYYAYKTQICWLPRKDLIDVYNSYIISLLEYCSVVWHSTLTVQQSHNIERVQKLCLKVILGSDYESYDQSLVVCGLEKLSIRRDSRCLKFGLKSLLHTQHCNLFPVNPHVLKSTPNRTGSYRMSSLPYIQRMLNLLLSICK